MNKKYFEVTVDLEVAIQKNGKPKIIKEVYLIDSLTVTEAEAKIIKYFVSSGTTIDYTISSVKQSRIINVVS